MNITHQCKSMDDLLSFLMQCSIVQLLKNPKLQIVHQNWLLLFIVVVGNNAVIMIKESNFFVQLEESTFFN